jgi:hypothetical protein
MLTPLSNHKFICLLQILRRDRAVQVPGDIHRAGALVLDVCRRAEEGIGSGSARNAVILKFTDEKQHPAAAIGVMDIALAGRRIVSRGALALPMEQLAADGIIVSPVGIISAPSVLQIL